MAQYVDASPLPNVKRYITAHDDEGKAVISKEIPEGSAWTAAGAEAKFFLGYATSTFPAELSKDADIGTYKRFLDSPPGLVIYGGTVLRYVDMAPGIISPMHRTTSLDYGVVLEGEVELILDSGEKRVLKRGDTAIQRGTNHAWRNTSETEWARMLYVLMEANPIVTKDGKVLGEDLSTMEGVRKSD
jgi:quercetin dioxygenase-like cupin family protein